MKINKIITLGFTILAVALVVMSGIMKLMQGQEMTDKMRLVGVDKYIIFFGLMEISFSILFLLKRTLRIGFILLSCYFAGAIAVELSYETSLNALLPMILIWIAAFLRDKDIFLGSAD